MRCLVQRHIGGRSMREISVEACEETMLGAVYTAILSTCLGRREGEKKEKRMCLSNTPSEK
jgi:hypothetical protein